jgi:hypothetical protein
LDLKIGTLLAPFKRFLGAVDQKKVAMFVLSQQGQLQEYNDLRIKKGENRTPTDKFNTFNRTYCGSMLSNNEKLVAPLQEVIYYVILVFHNVIFAEYQRLLNLFMMFDGK